MVRKGRKSITRGRKSTTRGRKRKSVKFEPSSSKKLKQTMVNSVHLEKPQYSTNMYYDDLSDESDDNERANCMKTLRENLGVNNRDGNSDDESDSIENNPDSPVLDSDFCMNSISPSDECVEYEVLSKCPVDDISQISKNQKNSMSVQPGDDIDQNESEDDSDESIEEGDVKLQRKKSSFNPQGTLDSNNAIEESNLEDYSDPFVKHLLCEIPYSLLSSINSYPKIEDKFTENWPMLGKLTVKIPVNSDVSKSETSTFLEEKDVYTQGGHIPKIYDLKHITPTDMHIKLQISNNWISQKNSLLKKKDDSSENAFMTPFQNELFSIINNYQDLYFTNRTFKNGEDIRFVYCLHILNHILKTRTKILHHNAKISDQDDISIEYRDQGLVRPKVLVLVPFMDSAYRIVSLLERLLFPINKGNVVNKKKFLEEYTGQEMVMPYRNRKPEDYELTFIGNVLDDFKIGISITKKSLKLYADFYNSDIIIASPLGLRRIIGAEGEESRDYDFLASIEVLILDQAEIFLMQNWNHLAHLLEHLHLQPKESHGVDFLRVRLWSLTGKAKFYRQTLIFSSFDTPEVSSVFNRGCVNYSGSIKNETIVEGGSISRVVVQLPHRFHKFSAASADDCIGKRFDFFVKNILPTYRDMLLKQVMIFIPDYYDFVKLRNYFRKEVISFVQICEYTKQPKVARARDIFYHGDAQFVLYTERFHFYNRIKLKGIRHLVFYQPPYSGHFYSEMCNLMQENYLNKGKGCNLDISVSVIYSKYDFYQLSAILGTERAHKMIKSERDTHAIVTGE